MANISDASGTITIKAKRDIAQSLACLIKYTQELGDYSTYLDFDAKKGIVDGDEVAENEYEYTFNGFGRWTYENNIENFYNWIKNDVYSNGLEDYYKRNGIDIVELKNLFETIKDNDWEIEFDITDAESGCAVLYQATCLLSHKAGEDKAEFTELECTEYDYTNENLIKLDFGGLVEDDYEEMESE